MKFSIEARTGYLHALCSGRESADDMRTFLLAVHQACRRHGVPRVLMSIRASRVIFRPEDYGLSGYANTLAGDACRVALVADTPELHSAHEYIEIVARQQGLDVRAFRDEPPATRWLRGMPEPSRRYRFARLAVLGAPLEAGVYALWDGDELIYYGRAASIRERLLEHLERGPAASHYSWEVCADPAAREAELMREFERQHGRRPRGNASG